MSDFDYGDEQVATDGLARLAKLATEQVAVERQVADAEIRLNELKGKLDRIAEITIPALMDELGVSQTRTSSGISVTVDTNIRASVSEDKDPQRFQRVVDYLENHGQFRMVKNEVKVGFDKTEAEKVPLLRKAAEALGLKNFEAKRSISHQTLSAYVRGELENGKELPEDDLGVYRQRRAKVVV